MIGGTSWYSTIEYYRYINSMIGEQFGKHTTPPLLLYSLNVRLMANGEWEAIRQTYLSISLKLQQAGAEAILICANTPHKVCPFVAPQLDIPFIHIADATAEEARRLGLDRLGLLGTKHVMEEDFISGYLKDNHNIQTLIPNQEGRELVNQLIVDELTQGVFLPDSRDSVIREMNVLSSQGAEGMILGCTELPILIQPKDVSYPILNTTYLHAKKAVEFILS